MAAFEAIGPLPEAEMTVLWSRSADGSVVCAASCAYPFTASTFVSGDVNNPIAAQIAQFDMSTGTFVADFTLSGEQQWTALKFLNSDVGVVRVQAGVPDQAIALGVTITFIQESEEA